MAAQSVNIVGRFHDALAYRRMCMDRVAKLFGTAIRRDALEKTLEGVRMEKYYAGLTTAQFLDLLLK